MTAPELKPCPFCGGAPYTSTRQDEDLSTRNIVDWKFVGCSNCDISFGIPDGYDCGTAYEQWNTRATSEADALRAENERLRDELDALAVCAASKGEHIVITQGNYKFCSECGETLTAKKIKDAEKAVAARAALGDTP